MATAASEELAAEASFFLVLFWILFYRGRRRFAVGSWLLEPVGGFFVGWVRGTGSGLSFMGTF